MRPAYEARSRALAQQHYGMGVWDRKSVHMTPGVCFLGLAATRSCLPARAFDSLVEDPPSSQATALHTSNLRLGSLVKCTSNLWAPW